MVRAAWNLACGGHSGLNRCVRFQSATKPPAVVNAATDVSTNRPLPVRSIPPPVSRIRVATAIFPLRPSLTQKVLLARKRTYVGGLPDHDAGPNPHPQGLALLVQEGFTTRRGQPLRFEHRRATREQVSPTQVPGTVEDPGV